MWTVVRRLLINHCQQRFDIDRLNCIGVHREVHLFNIIRLIIKHLEKKCLETNATRVLIQVQLLDRYKQKWPVSLAQVQRMDPYKH